MRGGGKLMQVGIDPGHGGHNPGAAGNGLVEKEITLDMAHMLCDALHGLGFYTVMTRETDADVGLTERGHATRYCDLVMVLHADANRNSSAGALGAYAMPGDDVAITMGTEIKRCAPNALRPFTANTLLVSPEDWTHRALNCIAHHRPRPTVLVEMFFLTNPKHVEFVQQHEGRVWLAATLALGVACGARALTSGAAVCSV